MPSPGLTRRGRNGASFFLSFCESSETGASASCPKPLAYSGKRNEKPSSHTTNGHAAGAVAVAVAGQASASVRQPPPSPAGAAGGRPPALLASTPTRARHCRRSLRPRRRPLPPPPLMPWWHRIHGGTLSALLFSPHGGLVALRRSCPFSPPHLFRFSLFA